MSERFVEGPGILIVPNNDVAATDGKPFTIALDEQYISELIAQKFGLQVQPRKEN